MDANRTNFKNRLQLQAKMTPEMCRAIKRQETNSGLDYWKNGFNNLNVSEVASGTPDKKPTYRRLTQVNFDFPGLFLPNVGKPPLPQKRKDTKGQPIVLNRTKTFIPEIKTGRSSSDVRTKSDSSNPSRKAAVTDLTCLQLADTLLSYNKSPFSGVHGTSTFGLYPSALRSRYVDLFCDKKPGEDSAIKDQHSKLNGEVDINETTDQERKIPILMYHTFQPDDNDVIAERQRDFASPSSDTQTIDIDGNAKPQTKPQKSILKNGLKKTRPSSETAISYTYSTLEKPTASSYQLPGTKSQLRSVSETRIPTSSVYPKIQNDLNDFGHLRRLRSIPVKHEITGTVRNIPVRLEREHTTSGCEYKGLENRKRSVRFNAAHEVREYTPCEPTRFC